MKQKIVILALLVVFAAGIAAFTLVYDRAVFDGSRIANSDSCRLDIARMTGSDRRLLYPAGWNIDYYPTNFIPYNGTLYYIDYECNPYMTEWDFAHWGAQYWTMQPPEG